MKVVAVPNTIYTAEQLRALVADYLAHPAFCYDLETIGDHRINPRSNIVTVMSLATDGRCDVVPMDFPNGELDRVEYNTLTDSGEKRRIEYLAASKEFHPRKAELSVSKSNTTYRWHEAPPHLNCKEAFAILRPLLMSDRLKVGHNLKFDLGSLHKYLGEFPAGPYADTMVAAYLVNSDWGVQDDDDFRHRAYGLRSTARRETGYIMAKGVGEDVSKHPWSAVMRYAALDAKFTWLSWRMLRRKIERDGLQPVMDLEMNVLRVLLDMERDGAPIDMKALHALSDRLLDPKNGLLVQAEKRVYDLVGYTFQIGKQEEKVKVVYGPKDKGGQGLICREKDKTGTGKESVRTEVLERFRHTNKVVSAILDHADLAKLHSTYVRAYLEGANPKNLNDKRIPLVVDDHIHADFNQIGAQTGRFSCRAPNLQNVPRPDKDMGKAMRALFVAPPGCKLIVADFGQIELRVLAHMSQDRGMVQAFLAGEDIHQYTADQVGITRAGGKALGFAVVYDAGPEKVASMAGSTVTAAKAFMALYDKRFPGVIIWKREAITACRRTQGPKGESPYALTLLGRKRYLPNLYNPVRNYRATAERQVANTIIQGSAADIMKLAMVRAHQMIPEGCRLILTVHDELVTIAPDHLAEEAAIAIGKAMQDAVTLTVPTPADIKIVNRWSEAKE